MLEVLPQEYEVLRPNAGLNADDERTLFRRFTNRKRHLQRCACLAAASEARRSLWV